MSLGPRHCRDWDREHQEKIEEEWEIPALPVVLGQQSDRVSPSQLHILTLLLDVLEEKSLESAAKNHLDFHNKNYRDRYSRIAPFPRHSNNGLSVS